MDFLNQKCVACGGSFGCDAIGKARDEAEKDPQDDTTETHDAEGGQQGFNIADPFAVGEIMGDGFNVVLA